jgi:hypothetical protein
MRRMRSGESTRKGLMVSYLARLVSGRAVRWRAVALLAAGLTGTTSVLCAESKTVTATLVVQVSEASLVEQQNGNVIIKLRLARGVAVNLWSGKSCTPTGDESQIITASGTYTIPFDQINRPQKAGGDEQGSICLQSSDGALRRSLPIIRRPSIPGPTADHAKSPLRSTWSGQVSIPAAPVPSASRAGKWQ